MKRTAKLVLVTLVFAGIFWGADQAERKVLRQPTVEYSELAKKNNLHGTVKLKLWISPAGEVRRTEYIGGHPVLAESALKAVKEWKYESAAAETTSVVEVKF